MRLVWRSVTRRAGRLSLECAGERWKCLNSASRAGLQGVAAAVRLVGWIQSTHLGRGLGRGFRRRQCPVRSQDRVRQSSPGQPSREPRRIAAGCPRRSWRGRDWPDGQRRACGPSGGAGLHGFREVEGNRAGHECERGDHDGALRGAPVPWGVTSPSRSRAADKSVSSAGRTSGWRGAELRQGAVACAV